MSDSRPPYLWRTTVAAPLKIANPLLFFLFRSDALYLAVFIFFCVYLSFGGFTLLALGINTLSICIPLGISLIPAVWVLVIDMLSLKDEWKKEIRRYKYERYREKKNMRRRAGKMLIVGPEEFCISVDRVLTELKHEAPRRYLEALAYLPKAKYRKNLSARRGNESVSGRSDGYFSVDGSGDNTKQLNTYEWFRFVFLHEVGHNVGYRINDYSENYANNYAKQVISEISEIKLKKSSTKKSCTSCRRVSMPGRGTFPHHPHYY